MRAWLCVAVRGIHSVGTVMTWSWIMARINSRADPWSQRKAEGYRALACTPGFSSSSCSGTAIQSPSFVFTSFWSKNSILRYSEYSTKVATGSPLSFASSALGGTVKQEIQLWLEAVLTWHFEHKWLLRRQEAFQDWCPFASWHISPGFTSISNSLCSFDITNRDIIQGSAAPPPPQKKKEEPGFFIYIFFLMMLR